MGIVEELHGREHNGLKNSTFRQLNQVPDSKLTGNQHIAFSCISYDGFIDADAERLRSEKLFDKAFIRKEKKKIKAENAKTRYNNSKG